MYNNVLVLRIVQEGNNVKVFLIDGNLFKFS